MPCRSNHFAPSSVCSSFRPTHVLPSSLFAATSPHLCLAPLCSQLSHAGTAPYTPDPACPASQRPS